MEYFNWNKEDIINSDLAPITKEILLGEINGTPASKDPNVPSNNPIFHLREKYQYYQYLKMLYREIPDLTLFIQHAYQDFNIATCIYEEIPEVDTTPEKLLKNTTSFYEFLGNKDILNQYTRLIQKEGILRIQPHDPSNPVCQNVNGRCILDKDTGNAFLSYYIKGTLDDFPTFAHETAHLIIETMLFGQMNPLIDKHFTEYAACYFQIISYGFYSIELGIPEIFPVLLHNNMVNIINNLWYLHIQKLIMQRKIIKASPTYIKKALEKENIRSGFTKNDISYFYLNPTKKIEAIASFLMALDSFVQNTPTFKEGVPNLLDTLTSSVSSISELFKNSNITFMEDNMHNFKELYEKSLGIHLK